MKFLDRFSGDWQTITLPRVGSRCAYKSRMPDGSIVTRTYVHDGDAVLNFITTDDSLITSLSYLGNMKEIDGVRRAVWRDTVIWS